MDSQFEQRKRLPAYDAEDESELEPAPPIKAPVPLYDLVLYWAWACFIVLVIAGLSALWVSFVVKYTLYLWR